MFDSSRRQFLQGASKSAAAAALLRFPLRPSLMQFHTSQTGEVVPARQLNQGWDFLRGPEPIPQGKWEAVTLPHCFNGEDACDPDEPYYRGKGWYRMRIPISNPFPAGRTILHFDGAGQTTSLSAGGKEIGVHEGGYDEFSFDITDAVQALSPAEAKEGVPILVCCDNSPNPDRVPSDLSDFCLYGGLYRHIQLVYLPSVALDAMHVLPTVNPDGSCEVSVKSRLRNLAARHIPCEVVVRVQDPSGKVVHESRQAILAWEGYTQIAGFHIEEPQLWSPETPHLYGCSVTLSSAAGHMRLEERFGIRHYEFVEHGPFRLNGKRVLLRGTQRHADHAGVAAAMSDDLVRREMTLIKEMGANFIRLAHYQQDRLVLDLCDELGLMVWEEAPWCRAGVGGDAFQENAKEMLANMIDQHYNHPSIILWGLGNEDDWPGEYPSLDPHAIRGFMTEMHDLAHQLDGSRLTSFRRCDFARDIPDVYSPSIWAGWYRGNYHEYEQSLLSERGRVKRFLHMEWGADSHAGRHSEDPDAVLGDVKTNNGTDERGLDYLKTGGDVRVSKDGDWSETYACHLFDWYLKTQDKLDWLTGSAQWIFKDFASPLRGDSGIPRINQKGVTERDLTLKESYYVFQSYWTEKPMAHIYGHSWPVRWGREGQARTVLIYSNCPHAELYLNGKSLGVRKRDSQDFPAAGLRWEVAFAKGLNHLRAVATKDGATVTDEIHLSYQTEPWGPAAVIGLTEKARKQNVVTVAAHVFDSNGILCLDAAQYVRFSLTGAGQLIDNLGTTRASREVQFANGHAEISFICKGSCSIRASPKGLPPVSLDFS